MALRAVQSRSLADQVFGQIVGEILVGRYAPGATLPAERTLVTIFDVNRHVVREALKRLEQIGLVKISQGDGTQVLDFKRHAGLDLLALMAEHARGGKDIEAIWSSVLEMATAIGADVARLCAERAPREVRDALRGVTEAMDGAAPEEAVGLELRFWDLVIEGAGNLAYRLAFNSMVKGAMAIPELAVPWVVEDLRSSTKRAELAEAIAAGDASRAQESAREALSGARAGFLERLGSVPPPPGDPEPPPVAAARREPAAKAIARPARAAAPRRAARQKRSPDNTES